jgi:DNA polymerase III subunit gamma/tau
MYQALYRKYRPIDFNSVVGQDIIIRTLKNSIINKTFSHAYMFFGPRGTGKTTVSKIFARSINCTNPVDGLACHECDACKCSFSKDCVDIIEIDAASNNGVDEIRELKNKISLVPSELKYKVYIIDEVHMLSIGAFNALLKTLEEPPEHAIFILATTDPQKVPETIISRCQCFSFKRISDDVIKNRLKFVCDEEKIDIDDEVLNNISIMAEGGLRDALGFLDKLVSFSNKKITNEDFIEINGIISNNELNFFLNDIMKCNFAEVLNKISIYNNLGKNLIQIMNQLLNFSRNLIVDYYLSNKVLDFSLNNLQLFVNLLNEKMFDIKKSGNTKIYIEMFLLKFINEINSKSTNLVENSIVEKDNLINSNKINNNNTVNVVKNNEYNSENVNNNVVDKSFSTNNSSDDDFDFSKEYSDEDEDFLSDNFSTNNNLVDNVENNKNSNDFIDNSSFVEKENSDIKKIKNIDEIIKVRVNNTLALADKKLLLEEQKNFELLHDFVFDQKVGYIVSSLLDSNLRAVSKDYIIISFEFDSNVNQNLMILDKITDVYNKITNSNKLFAIISDKNWDIVKNEYINNLKNNVKYQIMDEPDFIFEDSSNDDIITSSAFHLFGDIVEVE